MTVSSHPDGGDLSVSPFAEQSETLVDSEVVQLVVIIHQSGFDLLPSPQNQTQPIFTHHVELAVWRTRTRPR